MNYKCKLMHYKKPNRIEKKSKSNSIQQHNSIYLIQDEGGMYNMENPC